MKFIITADDFGVSPIIDDAIKQAILHGYVTHVACMVNGPNSVQVIKNLKAQFPNVSVGLHFTITSGKAKSNNPVSLIKNADKEFKGMVAQARFDTSTEAKRNQLKADIEAELKAQIEEFEKTGLLIEHFSDHVGIFTLDPFTADVYFNYCKTFNPQIPVRNPALAAGLIDQGCLRESQMYILGRAAGIVPGVAALSDNGMKQMLQRQQQAGLRTTDYFIEHLYKNPYPDILKCIMENAPRDPNALVQHRVSTEPIAEVVTHMAIKPLNNPSYQVPLEQLKLHGGIDATYLQRNRYREWEMMMAEMGNYKGRPGIELVSF